MALLDIFRPQTMTDDEYTLSCLLESLEDVVVRLADNDRLDYVNRCWTSLTGVSREESLKRTLTSFVHPEDMGIWKKAKRDIAEDGSSQLVWLRLISADDHVHWCEIRLQPMTVGTMYPMSATVCDITPQVRTDQVRNASLRSLKGLVNDIPVMIYRARNNLSWTMEYVSDGCEQVTGYRAEQLINQPQLSYGSLIDPADAGTVWQQVQEAIESHSVFEIRYRISDAYGKSRMVIDKGRGIYSDNGSILGVQGVIFDIADNDQAP